MGSHSRIIVHSSDQERVWLKASGYGHPSDVIAQARREASQEGVLDVAVAERTRARDVFQMIRGNSDAFRATLQQPEKQWIRMDRLLPIQEGQPFDLNHILREQPQSERESKTLMHLLDRAINQRWKDGTFQFSLSAEPDLSVFDGVPVQPYEHMMAQVAPGAVIGGLGKLHVRFGAGEREAARNHVHPGARIVAVVSGEGEFSAHREIEKPEEYHTTLQPGSVILMPGNTPHNFAAGDNEDMHVISIHVGYEDINDPKAMIYIDE